VRTRESVRTRTRKRKRERCCLRERSAGAINQQEGIRIYTGVYMCVHVYVHMHIYIYIYIYIIIIIIIIMIPYHYRCHDLYSVQITK